MLIHFLHKKLTVTLNYTRIRYVNLMHVKNLTHYTVSAEFYVMFLELCRGLELKFKSKVYVTLKKERYASNLDINCSCRSKQTV